MSLVLAEVTSSYQILQIIFKMPAPLSLMVVIPMEITPFTLVSILVQHLLWTLPFIIILVHQIDLASRGGELSVRVELLRAFTHFSAVFLAVSLVTIISFVLSFAVTSFFHHI